ncbi:MAG: flagellar hook-length control protein FliK [Thiobacillaceae bacterium]
MAMTPSLSPAGLAAGAPCAACTSPGGLAPGGPFATALSAAIQAGGGKPTAHIGLLLGVVAESGPPVVTLAAGQGGAAGLPDEATAVASAEGEDSEVESTAWAAVLLVGALPQAAAQAAFADRAAGGPASTATRPAAATLAGVASRTALGGSASEDGPATLAPDRQLLPATGADPDAVMDLTAGEGRLRPPAGTELSGPPPAIGDPLQRASGLTDAYAAAQFDRLQETGRPAFAREPLALQLPLRASGWDTELAQRIVWMAGRQAQWAEITVNPPNLGSIEVHLSLRGHDASAYFYSPQAVVREAIDESLGRLRDMLAAAGIQLGQAQVGEQSLTQRQAGSFLPTIKLPGAAGIAADDGPVNVRRGLVDLYI